jgi:type IV secretory pathway TraG/TraD family ATPase VirD4
MILNLWRDSGFFLGGINSTHYLGKRQGDEGHIIVYAPTGGGKGVNNVKTTTRTWKGSIYALDIKGEILGEARAANRPYKVIYLTGEENNYKIDLFQHFEKGSDDLGENAEYLANYIIPMSPQQGEEHGFWIESARGVLTGGCCIFLKSVQLL